MGSGYRWLEGPVWFADHDCLYVSDLPNDRVLRWSEGAGVEVVRTAVGFENGHARDCQGRLLSCSHKNRNISRREVGGAITILADRYDGRLLNSPNDIVCKSDGTNWFSDPIYGISTDYEGGKQRPELPGFLYRLDPDTEDMTPVGEGFTGPNGLAFSPDERWLYVAETGNQFDDTVARYIRRFGVTPSNTLFGGDLFYTVSPGNADGFRVDEDGRIWTSAGDGVHCISPDGELLGKILTGRTVSNVCFGGRNRSRLFICASHTLMAIYTNVRGCVRP
jgi:gluconolactonase